MNSKKRNKIFGGSVKSFMDKANQFLKKTQLLSTVGNVLNNSIVPMQYRGIGSKVVDFAKSKGFGRSRKIRRKVNMVPAGRIGIINRGMLGHGLKLAGQGINLAGSGRSNGMIYRSPNRLPNRLPSYF
jgi:hypothetical protein